MNVRIDDDLNRSVLTVREGKFGEGRLVPSPELGHALLGTVVSASPCGPRPIGLRPTEPASRSQPIRVTVADASALRAVKLRPLR